MIEMSRGKIFFQLKMKRATKIDNVCENLIKEKRRR